MNIEKYCRVVNVEYSFLRADRVLADGPLRVGPRRRPRLVPRAVDGGGLRGGGLLGGGGGGLSGLSNS